MFQSHTERGGAHTQTRFGPRADAFWSLCERVLRVKRVIPMSDGYCTTTHTR